MEKKNSVTTKTGDNGTTHLFSGEEVPKNSLRPEIYGFIDELLSLLSNVKFNSPQKDVENIINSVENELRIVASELATSKNKLDTLQRRVDSEMVAEMDKRINNLEITIKLPNSFINFKEKTSIILDGARTLTRKIERRAVSLYDIEGLKNRYLLIWLNRLSDLLYLLALREERKQDEFTKNVWKKLGRSDI